MNATIGAQQNVLPPAVVPVLGGGGEAVTTGVALQLLFAVLAVKVIFAGRAQVQEFTGGGSGGSVDWSGSRSSFNPPKHSLSSMPTVGSRTCCFRGFLPIVIEGD